MQLAFGAGAADTDGLEAEGFELDRAEFEVSEFGAADGEEVGLDVAEVADVGFGAELGFADPEVGILEADLDGVEFVGVEFEVAGPVMVGLTVPSLDVAEVDALEFDVDWLDVAAVASKATVAGGAAQPIGKSISTINRTTVSVDCMLGDKVSRIQLNPNG